MARTAREKPRELSSAWPTEPSPDRNGEAARVIAIAVADEVKRRGLRPFALELGVHHATLLGVIAGQVWPSLQLVVALERVLDRRVWPDRSSLPGAH